MPYGDKPSEWRSRVGGPVARYCSIEGVSGPHRVRSGVVVIVELGWGDEGIDGDVGSCWLVDCALSRVMVDPDDV